MIPVIVTQGNLPVILGMPHGGTYLPPEVLAGLNDRGRQLADADWHIDRLYEGLLPGASVVRAQFHRYVIDANRAPGDESLYPGQNTTGLVPATDFDGDPIWDRPVTATETAARLADWHAPYHAALRAEVERVRAIHGVAVLWDCHSIRSHIPFLFSGRLPDFNIGDNNGTTCDPRIPAIMQRIASAPGFTHVVNGRFRGGWTTRHYSDRARGIHTVQMEMAQAIYLQSETAPFAYSPDIAAPARERLSRMLHEINALAPSLKVMP